MPDHLIREKSRWYTRGWTYQEGIVLGDPKEINKFAQTFILVLHNTSGNIYERLGYILIGENHMVTECERSWNHDPVLVSQGIRILPNYYSSVERYS